MLTISKGKTTATTISLLLMFAMAVSLVALPTATAQDTRKIYAYIGAIPNPAGVGQEVLLHVGITLPLMQATHGWEGLTVEVTRPDGHTETLGPFRTDSTGGTGTIYTPTMEGNYTLRTHFPEQVNPHTISRGDIQVPEGTVMLESYSEELTLVVQEEPTPIYPGHALPTEYWSRPIDPQLREWYTIAGNWLYWSPRNLYAPYNDDAPETAHILWAKPLAIGGIAGGALGDPALDALGYHSFEEGDAYEAKWGGRGGGPILMAGKLYYEIYAAGDIHKETTCVDLRTGEELWSRPLINDEGLDVVVAGTGLFGSAALFGQLMYWDTYDYHGIYDYLWVPLGNTWYAFDPANGDWVYTLIDVPSGTRVFGPKGEILIYSINLNSGYMTIWNSTNIPALYQTAGYASMDWGRWRPMGKTVNATGPHGVTYDPLGNGLERNPSVNWPPYEPSILPTGLNGYQLNVSIPDDLPGSVRAVLDDRVIGASISNTEMTSWGLNLDPSNGAIGQLLFKKTWNAPSEWEEGDVRVSFGAVSSQGENGVFTLWAPDLRKNYAFSTETGDYLWETPPEHYLSTIRAVRYIAYGKLISTGISGVIHAYDLETGETAWEYHATDPYSEILWANDWWMRPVFITDGKLYVGHLEHSPIDPKPRGAPFVCLNMTTGEEIWRADGLFRLHYWGGGPALIGDSIIVVRDTYDNRVYAVGKGPSATTITAAPEVSKLGSSVMVKGLVTDISTGTEDPALTSRFPQGVPAVSDADMSEWMLYVYKQFERPADITGVEVVVSVVDPNNNVYEVGRTTSDTSGGFKLMFTPEVPGEYTVIATFDGSAAYWPSYAQTYFGVEEAPAAAFEPTPTPASMTDTYVLGIGAGAIIAILVVGLLLFLTLRKR